MLSLLGRRLARSIRPTVASHLERLAAPATFTEVQRPQRYFSSSAEYPFEKITEEITDGDETLDPPGTPWTPSPVAQDYEETLHVLLHGGKIEPAMDILGRMVKRGFRPSPEIVDLLYTVTKEKPEHQAMAVKTINSLDLSAWK